MAESLQDWHDREGITWRQIAARLNVSERTVYRRNAAAKTARRKSRMRPQVDRRQALDLIAAAPCAGTLEDAWIQDPRHDIARAVWLRDNYCSVCPARDACHQVLQPTTTGMDGICAGDLYIDGRALAPAEIGDLFAANTTRSQLDLFAFAPTGPDLEATAPPIAA